MSDNEQLPAPRTGRTLILGGALLAAALGGAYVARLLSPQPYPSKPRQTRPIVQIVRQQPGLPDLADLVDRLCPSVAVIVPEGTDIVSAHRGTPLIPASSFSTDGWLVTSAAALPQGALEAVFGDGRRVALSDLRSDPVSGLAILKAADPGPPMQFNDQLFPRVGQFGFALTTPMGSGCSADVTMIGSDFLADGGGLVGYVRLQSPPDAWVAGTPLLGTDGRVLGIGTSDPAGALIPATIATVILDELIRNSLSASTGFGFRAIDYAPPLSTRLGDLRSGAGVALVQAKSAAGRSDLRAGDVITAVDDLPVSSASELSRSLDGVSQATLTVQRRSRQLKISVKPPRQPALRPGTPLPKTRLAE